MTQCCEWLGEGALKGMGAITRAWAGGEGGISGLNKAGVGGWGRQV